MTQIPDHYLEVADRLSSAESVPDDALATWWAQWYMMLADGGQTPNPAGYSALKEMQRSLDAKAERWRAWLDRTEPVQLPARTREDGQLDWSSVDRRRVLRDQIDLSSVLTLVDCGASLEEAQDTVRANKLGQANHAINRSRLLGVLLGLFEDFGIVGDWPELRGTYPRAVGRMRINDLVTLPETIDSMAEAAGFVPRMAAPVEGDDDELVRALFGTDEPSDLPDKLADLFPDGPPPAPPGVDETSHRRTLIIAQALEDSGLDADYFGDNGAFLTWACEHLDVEVTATREALKRAGVFNGKSKSGVRGVGLDVRLRKLRDYLRENGADGRG